VRVGKYPNPAGAGDEPIGAEYLSGCQQRRWVKSDGGARGINLENGGVPLASQAFGVTQRFAAGCFRGLLAGSEMILTFQQPKYPDTSLDMAGKVALTTDQIHSIAPR
jgi:hypothetical protein